MTAMAILYRARVVCVRVRVRFVTFACLHPMRDADKMT
jgi:hypothetical protein